MNRQCAWCLKIYDFHTKEWTQGPAVKLINATHGMCPECETKNKKEYEEYYNKKKVA